MYLMLQFVRFNGAWAFNCAFAMPVPGLQFRITKGGVTIINVPLVSLKATKTASITKTPKGTPSPKPSPSPSKSAAALLKVRHCSGQRAHVAPLCVCSIEKSTTARGPGSVKGARNIEPAGSVMDSWIT